MSFATDATALLDTSTDLADAVAALESAVLAHRAAVTAAVASARTDATATSVMTNPEALMERSICVARGYVLATINRLYPDAVAAAGPGTSPAVHDGKTVHVLTKGEHGTP